MTSTITAMQDLDLSNKVLLIREDLNAPLRDGLVTSDARLRAAIPSINMALSKGGKVILMSHCGRPTEGQYSEEYSLKPIAAHLAQLLGQEIPVLNNWREEKIQFDQHSVQMLENVRFNNGEKTNDDALSKAYAQLADIFVMDAFGTAHRAQASTAGVAKYSKQCCAGPLLVKELNALQAVLQNPAKPLLAVVGGSKVSTKLAVLNRLSEIADHLIIGGGIANTFLAAAGYPVGKSLYEADLVDTAKQLLSRCDIPLPVDVYVAKAFSADAQAELKLVADVADDDMILDIGPQTQQQQAKIIEHAKTILWNGPVGVFEFEQFASGTKALSLAIANSAAFSVAGGGDTLAAIDEYAVADQISYISTGGGAFLEMVEGKLLPAVEALRQA